MTKTTKAVAVLLWAVLLVLPAGCVKEIPLPPDQARFSQRLDALRERHAKARSQHNDLRITAVEAEARKFFDAPPRVEAWVGTVAGVNSFVGAKWISVEAGGVTYQLRPQSEEVRQHLARFSKGDWVQFSGDVTVETNLTMGQAIRAPELVVAAFEVEPYWDERIGGQR